MLRRDAIRGFLTSAAEDLQGDWVLLGGALVALLFDPERGTEDIDLVALHPDQESRVRLMDAAARAGLGVETVNSAADFFLRRIDGWENDLLPMVTLGGLTVWRPGPRLFVRLKAGRMTERDLADCLLALEAEGAGLDWSETLAWLRDLDSETREVSARRQALVARIESQ